MTARYSSVAVALHWAIAVLILGQIAGGLYMHNLPNSAAIKFPLYQLHKSFGLSILALTVLRLAWRLAHKVPVLPATTPRWQKIAARATHGAFYALLILTPLAGWAMVSVSPTGIPTVWFGLVEIPHLPFFEGVADRGAAEDAIAERHEFLAFTILFLLALHVGAALKHGFFDRDGVLRSMAPATISAWIALLVIFGALGVGATKYWSELSRPAVEERADQDRAVERVDEGMQAVVGAPRVEPAAEKSPPPADIEPSVAMRQAPPPAMREAAERAITPEGAPAEIQPAVAPPDNAQPNWIVDYDASALRFIGEEKGVAFQGRFSDFSAEIFFNPEFLDLSWIEVEVRTASGATGDPLRDATIAGGGWFDVKDYPTAQFSSAAIGRTGGNAYAADGQLTIKGMTAPVTLAFTLEIDGDDARAKGGAELIRTDFALGADASWLEEEDVALGVRVELEIVATRRN